LDLHALDDIVGGGALALLQEIFSRAAGSRSGVYRIEANLPLAGGGRHGGVGIPAGAPGSAASTSTDPAAEQVVAVHGFITMKSPDRWWQEAKMMYGAAATEKALKVMNGLLNAMMPEYLEEEKVRKAKEEEEKKKREEEARKRKEEAEIARRKKEQEEEEARKKKEEEEAAKRRAEEETRAKEAAESMEVEEPTPGTGSSSTAAPQEPERERIIVTINGNPIDISGKFFFPLVFVVEFIFNNFTNYSF
jgi:E3 ubiquitin-protein ligase HUWE1